MANDLPGLFITGTDTGVGKTYVTAIIARSLVASGRRVGVYKPAASGCVRNAQGSLLSDDALALWEAAGRPGDLEHVCPQCFAAPLAPHLAARAEGREIDAGLLRTGLDYWRSRSDVLLVEGAGGLMSPLGDDDYVADLARDLGFPLIVVSRNVLGTINATLQTLIAACVYRPSQGIHNVGQVAKGPMNAADWQIGKLPQTGMSGFCCDGPYRDGLEVAGVVLNHPAPPSPDDISLATNRSELAARCAAPLLATAAFGAEGFDSEVDWWKLARGGK